MAETSSNSGRERQSYSVRVGLLYAGMFAVFGLAMPYFSPWMASRGLSVGEIAIIATLPQLLRPFTAPALAFIADRRHNHRVMLVVLAVVALGGWIGLNNSSSFWSIFLFQLIVGSTAAMMPLAETVAIAGVKRYGADYARMRLWGSVTFIIATLGGGWSIARYGIDAVMWLIIACSVLTVAAALRVPSMPDDGSKRAAISIKAAAALVTDPTLVLVFAAAAAIQASHVMLYTYGTILWQALGYSTDMIGAFWAVSVAVEIAVFWFGGARLRKLGPANVLALAAATAIVRWTLMVTDPSLPLLLVLQVSHAVSFGVAHLGAMFALEKYVPEGKGGTAQALLSVVTALTFAAATPFSARAFSSGGALGYAPMAVLSVFALLAALALRQRLHRLPITSTHPD
jgi:MFS transporter, PPP family, 3-phenylpropionic acid transporter